MIGKTGSGKSSLLKTLYGALPLEDGIGDVAGFDLTLMDRKTIPQLRRKIGIVFQDFNLLSDRSVSANLLFVLKATDWKGKAKIKERIEEVLAEVGLEGKEDKMPHQLSGGEQQIVACLRSLQLSPAVLLLDEPTASLDDTATQQLEALIAQWQQNNPARACIWTSHDPAQIDRGTNRQIVLSAKNH